MKVIVASQNPVKLSAAKSAFEKTFPESDFFFEGISFPSNVRDQPMTDEETLRGAENRASNAQGAIQDADFWIGMEGGLEDKNGKMEAFAWMVVVSKNKMSRSRTATFLLPGEIANLVRGGMELAHADDQFFGRKNSGYVNGAVGLLTHDIITRSIYYEHAMILALIPFKNDKLY